MAETYFLSLDFGSIEGADEGPLPMDLAISAELETGKLLDLQWLTRDGELIPLNCMPPGQSCVSD